jgi:hypothetical protein
LCVQGTERVRTPQVSSRLGLQQMLPNPVISNPTMSLNVLIPGSQAANFDRLGRE